MSLAHSFSSAKVLSNLSPFRMLGYRPPEFQAVQQARLNSLNFLILGENTVFMSISSISKGISREGYL